MRGLERPPARASGSRTSPPGAAGRHDDRPGQETGGPEVERLYQPKVDRVVLGRLLQYARPYRARLLLAVGLLLAVSGAELLFPLLTRSAIDDRIRLRDLRGLGRLSLAYLGLLLAVFGVRYWQMVLMQATGQRITTDLRAGLFAHLQTLDARYFERHPVGRIMTRLTGDVETLNELFTSGLVAIFGDLITLAGIAGVLVWLHPGLALAALSVVPPLLVVTLVFRAKVRTAYALIRVRIAAINAFLQESLAGISLVQLFHREKLRAEEFSVLNAAHRDAFLRSVFYYSVYFPVVELLEAAALALILWYGGGAALREAITLGSLVAFIQYSERFFRPIRDLSERYNILQGAMASSERIFDLLDTEPAIVSPARMDLASAIAGGASETPPPAVEFRDVRFAYLPGEDVLQGLSFSLARGESVALVGRTGAGKTTVSSLLARFYDVTEGSIVVEGRDVRDWELPELRRRVGMVPQEVMLWTGGVRLNVALRAGRPPERVEEAIRIAGLSGLLRRFGEDGGESGVPENMPGDGGGRSDDQGSGATVAATAAAPSDRDRGALPPTVGERGAQLSSGERQLIAIARALAADPPILVLDEATSNVDTETEQRIRAALRELLHGRTSLVIAHRLSTIRHVDRILVLHHGRLVEEGRHEELLRRRGIYARYYELEYRGQEVGA